MGEAAIRPVMTSHGDGIYRSNDGGDSWEHVGLDDSRTISDVLIHPKDHNTVYVGVQGDQYQGSKARGIYRSVDGGKNWEKVFYVNEFTGVSGLSMDQNRAFLAQRLSAVSYTHLTLPTILRV